MPCVYVLKISHLQREVWKSDPVQEKQMSGSHQPDKKTYLICLEPSSFNLFSLFLPTFSSSFISHYILIVSLLHTKYHGKCSGQGPSPLSSDLYRQTDLQIQVVLSPSASVPH